MCVPLRSASRSHGAIYVDRVASVQAFSEPELDLLAAIGRQAGLAIERTRAHEATEQMFLSCVRALVNAIEAKDVYTSGHSERVASHAMSIAERLGLDSKTSDAVRLGALLHDIGKIGVPEAILTKQGRLTPEEFDIIKTHPSRGADILGAIKGIDLVVAAVRWHHEAINGLGYPDKLRGPDIPMPARIVAVADAFDAMTSNRSYRRNLSVEEAMREFRRCAGSQFDGDVCEAMVGLLESGTILPSQDLSALGIDIRTRIYTRKGA
jgi:putative nucleotidyltransferase with HDIG domain